MANNIFKELEKGSLPGLKRVISLFPSSVNAKNSVGATPLHVAASQGLSSFVKELLVHGAPHDITDGQGNLPLHLAAEQGSLDSVTELLTGPGRKLVVKAKNREGLTPLHLAVRNGHSAVVAKLLDAGARTDAKDKAGVTPLELVSADDEQMLQLLLDGTPTNSLGSMSTGIGTASPSARQLDQSQSLPRQLASGSLTPSAVSSGASGRLMTPPPVSVGGAMGSSKFVSGTPSTPPSRIVSQAPAAAGRAGQATGGGAVTNRSSMSAALTPGATGSRLPRNVSTATTPSVGAPAQAAASGAAAGASAVAGGASSVNAQFQKQDAAIQALKAGLRAATERLGAVDACAAAQLECAAQVEKALEACGTHGRALADLDARVGFQEERGRDTRSRLERLEEGERSLQVSVSRLTEDQHGLGSQLQKLAEQVASSAMSAAGQQQATAASQAQQQLQLEFAALKAQVEQLAPSLVVATAASAEARTLSARLDALQQQVQTQQATHLGSTLGGNVVLDQQVLQLQAQVQLLQLPVASLTQQCADLSTRLAGMLEWQQQARSDLSRLAEAQASQAGGSALGGELSDAVMRVLDTTARTMAELRQQQDETAKTVIQLQQQLQQQQQQQNGVPVTPQQQPVQSGVPSTPQGSRGGSVDAGPLGGPPSRNLSGLPSLSSMARDAAAQAEMRAELEALKNLVADVRKEVASEGGSLRREWQRAFSDMQTRYGEQTNELRAREQNIAKLREAAMMEEAERRAASGYEEKVAQRLGKLETGLEYLTHRLEVLEEQVSGLANNVTEQGSPPVALSPAGLPPHGRVAKQDSHGTPRSGPGPVSENLSSAGSASPRLTAAAAATAAASMVPVVHGAGFMSSGYKWRALARPTAMGGGDITCRERYCLTSGGGQDSQQVTTGTVVRQTESSKPSARSALESMAPSGQEHDKEEEPEEEEWWRAAHTTSSRIDTDRETLAATARSRWAPSLGGGGATSARGTAAAAASQSDYALTCRTSECEPAGSAAIPGAGQPSDATPSHAALGGAAVQQQQGSAGLGLGPRPSRTIDLHQMHPSHVKPPPADIVGGGVGLIWTGPGKPLEGPLESLPANSNAAGRSDLMAWEGVAVNASGQDGVAVDDVSALDPANVMVGPQLLPVAAQALLAPSVDIQRLAAAAAAQQQHQQHAQRQLVIAQQELLILQEMRQQQERWAVQQQQQVRPPGVGPSTHAARVPVVGSTSRESPSEHGSSRKEPPMCFFCPVQ